MMTSRHTEFRPLNETEIHAFDRAIDVGEVSMLADYSAEDLRVSYDRVSSNGICICIIIAAREGQNYPPVLFRGAGSDSSSQGNVISFSRAIRDREPVTVWPSSVWKGKTR